MVEVLRGKYRIVREIARSNDIVYEATDTALGRRVALKELNLSPNLTGTARRERIERFSREARATGRLSHPNIVSVFDFGEENGRHFIAMEFLEGQTLRDSMQVRGAFPLKEALDIACQVLDALAYAHQNRVIHRDIKPDNIYILPGGQVKLTDFGIARLTEEPALTSNGQVFGTPSYMSPEQIEGRDIDHRSDLFSAGVLLYEMLAGRKPFTGDSVVSITYAIMHADPLPLTGAPTGVEQVIRHALSKNPQGRQASAGQLKLDLRNAEQTPAAFFAPPGRSANGNYTGMSGFPGSNVPGSNSSLPPSSSGFPGPLGQNPGTSGGYTVPPAAPAANGGLPWAWNGSAPAANGAQGPPAFPGQAPPAGPLGPLAGAGGMAPYAFPPFPTRPREPLFVLSPSGRTFLLCVLVAALIGGGIVAGVIAFMHSYERYTVNVGTQHVTDMMNQGIQEYNAGDYSVAADQFNQALAANPSPEQQKNLNQNLAYTYVHLAQGAEKNRRWTEARAFYQKALNSMPDYKTAQEGLEGLRGADGSAAPRTPAPAADKEAPPATLETHTYAAPAAVGDPNFEANRRAEAQKLIDEGKTLYRLGHVDEARAKWNKAIELAPGTSERDEAEHLRRQTESAPPEFGG